MYVLIYPILAPVDVYIIMSLYTVHEWLVLQPYLSPTVQIPCVHDPFRELAAGIMFLLLFVFSVSYCYHFCLL